MLSTAQVFDTVGWTDTPTPSPVDDVPVRASRKRSRDASLERAPTRDQSALRFDAIPAAITEEREKARVIHAQLVASVVATAPASPPRARPLPLSPPSLLSPLPAELVAHESQDSASVNTSIPNDNASERTPGRPDTLPRSVREIFRQSSLNRATAKAQRGGVTGDEDGSEKATDCNREKVQRKKRTRRDTGEFLRDIQWSDAGTDVGTDASAASDTQTSTPAPPAAFDYESAIQQEEQRQQHQQSRQRQQPREPVAPAVIESAGLRKARAPKFLASRQFTARGR